MDSPSQGIEKKILSQGRRNFKDFGGEKLTRWASSADWNRLTHQPKYGEVLIRSGGSVYHKRASI